MNRNVLCKDLCSSKESVVMFGKVCNSLDAVDFTIDERSQLVQLLAAVLLTGDLVSLVSLVSCDVVTSCCGHLCVHRISVVMTLLL